MFKFLFSDDQPSPTLTDVRLCELENNLAGFIYDSQCQGVSKERIIKRCNALFAGVDTMTKGGSINLLCGVYTLNKSSKGVVSLSLRDTNK